MTQFSNSDSARAFIRQTGRNLRIARKRRLKTIAEVAEMVGVSASTIKRIEAGDPSVKFGIYLALIEVFQLEEAVHFAEPESDVIGIALEKQRLPERIRAKKDQRLDF